MRKFVEQGLHLRNCLAIAFTVKLGGRLITYQHPVFSSRVMIKMETLAIAANLYTTLPVDSYLSQLH